MWKPAFKPGFDLERQVLRGLDGYDDQIGLGCDFGSFGGDSRIVEVSEAAPGNFKIEV